MRASCFKTPVRAEDTRKARGQTARARPEGGSRALRSENPPPGRPPARGARAEAPTCRQRAPKIDSSTPTRQQRLARAAGSSPGPHLDLGASAHAGSPCLRRPRGPSRGARAHEHVCALRRYLRAAARKRVPTGAGGTCRAGPSDGVPLGKGWPAVAFGRHRRGGCVALLPAVCLAGWLEGDLTKTSFKSTVSYQ